MSTQVGAAVRPLVREPAGAARRRDHRFFSGMAVAALVIAFTGFAPSYYLGAFFGASPHSALVHVHGAVFTSWLVLFLAQTSLVSAGRTDLHRRLGPVAAALALIMLVVGYLTAVEAARHGVTPPGGPPPLAFLSVPLGTVTVFAILVAAGVHYRRRSETHKRFMLLATIAVLTPAFARMRWLGAGGPPVAIGGTCLLVLACMFHDRRAHGRIHPVFLWAGLLLMLSLPARFAVGGTDGWLAVAGWLTR